MKYQFGDIVLNVHMLITISIITHSPSAFASTHTATIMGPDDGYVGSR